MAYGYFISGQLIVKKKQSENSKPLVYTQKPNVSNGYRTIFHWEENENNITQVWEVVESEIIDPSEEATPEELLSIIVGDSYE